VKGSSDSEKNGEKMWHSKKWFPQSRKKVPQLESMPFNASIAMITMKRIQSHLL